MSHRISLLVIVASVGALAIVPAAFAHVYSSGDIDKRIGDLGRTVDKIKVNKDVDITDLNVRVRITHSANEDLLIGLLGPRHEFTELVSQSDASGANFGSGPKSCDGTFTTFDDEAGTTIPAGSDPYAGSFSPSESLNGEYAGDSSRFSWKLYAFDLNQSDHGTLHCWQLDISG